MKKLILTVFAAVMLVSCGEKKTEGNLHLTGNVQGLKQGKLYLRKMGDTALVTVDSIVIDGDAHFDTWLNVKSPEMYYLFLNRGVTRSIDDRLPFFAEPGNMNIETTLERFYAKAKISGSENQALYEQYKTANTRYTDQNTALLVEKLRAQRLGKTERLDSLERAQKNVLKRKYLYAINFALNNKDHEIAPYIVLTEINDVSLPFLDTIQKSMSPKVAQSLYGKKLTQYYNDRKKLGE